MAPYSSHMHPLAPSVEEAYRRKCIQLRRRTREVEDSNEAARLRVDRVRRQVEKLRLERAFLLEQLARRTSANVEDSDGSESPPPTPKDKPLRSKRGHRKPSIIAELENRGGTGGGGSGSAGEANNKLGSPATGSLTPQAQAQGLAAAMSLRPPRRPGTAFELYCADARPGAPAEVVDATVDDGLSPSSSTRVATITTAAADAAGNTAAAEAAEAARSDHSAGAVVAAAATAAVDEVLARGWEDLPAGERDAYQARSEREMANFQREEAEYARQRQQHRDVDVAGINDDAEEQDAQTVDMADD